MSSRLKALLSFLFLLCVVRFYSYLHPSVCLRIIDFKSGYCGLEAKIPVWISRCPDGGPVEAGSVVLRLFSGNRLLYTNTAVTGENGFTVVGVKFPEKAGKGRIVVEGGCLLSSVVVTRQVNWERPLDLALTLSRPLVRPGESVTARLLARRAVDLKPCVHAEGDILLIDPSGRRLLATPVLANEFGVAAVSFPLSSTCLLGEYTVRASVDGVKAESRFELGRESAKQINIAPLFPIAEPLCFGRSFNIGFRLSTWDGRGLADRPLRVELLSGDDRIASYEMKTDVSGRAAGTVRLPACGHRGSIDARLLVSTPGLSDERVVAGFDVRIVRGGLVPGMAKIAGSDRLLAWVDRPGATTDLTRFRLSSLQRPGLSHEAVERIDGSTVVFSLEDYSADEELLLTARAGERQALLSERMSKLPFARIRRLWVDDKACELWLPALGAVRLQVWLGYVPVLCESFPGGPGRLRIDVLAAMRKGGLAPGASYRALLFTGDGSECLLDASFPLCDAERLKLELSPGRRVLAPGGHTRLVCRVSRGGVPAGRSLIGLSVHDGALGDFAATPASPRPVCSISTSTPGFCLKLPLSSPGEFCSYFLLAGVAFLFCTRFLRQDFNLLLEAPFNPAKTQLTVDVMTGTVLICSWLLLAVVLPQFCSIYDSMGIRLPLLTRFLLSVSSAVSVLSWPVSALVMIATAALCFLSTREVIGRARVEGGRWLVAAGLISPVLAAGFLVMLVVVPVAVFTPMYGMVNGLDGSVACAQDNRGTTAASTVLSPGAAPAGRGPRRRFPGELLCRPLVETDDQGVARIELPQSDKLTTYLIRAEANTLGGGRVTSESSITYSAPLHVEPVLCRYAYENDEVEIPLIVFLASGGASEVKIQVAVSPGGARVLRQPEAVVVAPGVPAGVTARLRFTRAGEVGITVRASAGELRDESQRRIEVRPAGFAAGSAKLVSGHGKSLELSIQVPDRALPGTARYRLWALPGLAGRLADTLSVLSRSPAGGLDSVLAGRRIGRSLLNLLSSCPGGRDELAEATLDKLRRGLTGLGAYSCPRSGWFGFGPGLPKGDIYITAQLAGELWKERKYLDALPGELEELTRRLLVEFGRDKWGRPGESGLVGRLKAFAALSAPEVRNGFPASPGERLRILRAFDRNARCLVTTALALSMNSDYAALGALLAARSSCGDKALPKFQRIFQGYGDPPWGRGGGGESAEITTALVCRALFLFSKLRKKAIAGANWLIGRRGASGLWSDCETTSLVIDALCEASREAHAPSALKLRCSLSGQQKSLGLSGPAPVMISAASLEDDLDVLLTADKPLDGWIFRLSLSWFERQALPAPGIEHLSCKTRWSADMLRIDLENLSADDTGPLMLRVPLPVGLAVSQEEFRGPAADAVHVEVFDSVLRIYRRSIAPAGKAVLRIPLIRKFAGRFFCPVAVVYPYRKPDLPTINARSSAGTILLTES